MANEPVEVTPTLLRDWRLESGEGSKHERGRVVVIGGARQTPGGVLLAGVAALRAGAGHLTLAVAESVAPTLAVTTPEAGVIGLPEEDGSVVGDLSALLGDVVEAADVVVLGPGLDDADASADLAISLLPSIGPDTCLLLDAYALARLPDWHTAHELPAQLILTPNSSEAELLLGRPTDDDLADGRELAERYGATICCGGTITATDGQQWRVGSGHVGLATSGSGDVLAGAVAGLVGRATDPGQACCWATYAHAAAGDRLAAQVGRLGFLAREIADTLPVILLELGM